MNLGDFLDYLVFLASLTRNRDKSLTGACPREENGSPRDGLAEGKGPQKHGVAARGLVLRPSRQVQSVGDSEMPMDMSGQGSRLLKQNEQNSSSCEQVYFEHDQVSLEMDLQAALLLSHRIRAC